MSDSEITSLDDEFNPQQICDKDFHGTSARNTITGGNFPNSTIHMNTGDVIIVDQHQEIDVNVELSKLKDVLDEKAEEVVDLMTLPIQLDVMIQPVPLQLTNEPQRSFEHLDEEGHYSRREDYEKIFKHRHGNTTLSHLFDLAEDNAKTEADRVCKTERAKEKYKQKHGNIVAVTGQAGIGKSTLSRMLVQGIIDHEILPNNEYSFYIPFRYVDFVKSTNLLQFALAGCSSWEHETEKDKVLLRELKDNPNVVFIFDGLDEANTDQFSKPLFSCNIFEECNPSAFVKNLFAGNIFPKSKKFFTSRPRQFFELHPDCRPKFVTEILGLSEDSHDQLCQMICKEKYEKVKEYLEEHPDVKASCYVPAKCIITLAVLAKSINEQGELNIESLTHIFTEALKHYAHTDHVRETRESQGSKILLKLMKLAWNGFKNRKIIFDEDDFKESEIDQETFGSFLVTFVGLQHFQIKIIESDKKSSFSHLIWQELFSAAYIMLIMTEQEFNQSINEVRLKENRWEVVTQFMFGFCNPVVMREMRNVLCLKRATDFAHKKSFLLNLAKQSLSRCENNRDSEHSLLRVLSWIRETNLDEFDNEVIPVLPEELIFSSNSRYDASCFIDALRKTKKFHDLSSRIDITWDGPKHLFKTLPTLTQVKRISLNLVGASDDEAEIFADYPQEIVELGIRDLQITAAGVSLIVQKIESFQKPIQYLKLTGINDVTLPILLSAFHKTLHLKLSYCALTNTCFIPITEKLSTLINPCPIKKLRLGSCNIADEIMVVVINALDNMEELEIQNGHITNDFWTTIATKIASFKKPIKRLDFSRNKLKDDAMVILANTLHNTEELILQQCDITSFGFTAIAEKLSTLSKPKKLDFSYTKLKDDDVIALTNALHNIEELHLDCCEITNTGAKSIAKKLPMLTNPLKKLSLTYNQIDAEGIIALAQCIDYFQQLEVGNCRTSEEFEETIQREERNQGKINFKVNSTEE